MRSKVAAFAARMASTARGKRASTQGASAVATSRKRWAPSLPNCWAATVQSPSSHSFHIRV